MVWTDTILTEPKNVDWYPGEFGISDQEKGQETRETLPP